MLLLLRRSLRLETGVLHLQLSEAFGLLGLHPSVLLSPAVVGRLGHLDHTTDLDDGLALGDKMLGGLELANDLLGRVPEALHSQVPGPVWPAEDFHSPCTVFRDARYKYLPWTEKIKRSERIDAILKKRRLCCC